MAEIGRKPTDAIPDEMMGLIAVLMVVDMARINPFTTKSNFARDAANEIAVAASEGFISTRLDENKFTNRWMITMEGLQFLEDMKDVIAEVKDAPIN